MINERHEGKVMIIVDNQEMDKIDKNKQRIIEQEQNQRNTDKICKVKTFEDDIESNMNG